MKVLLLNGSPRANGNTALALAEMEKVFAQEGIETEAVQVGKAQYDLPEKEKHQFTNFIR